MALHGVFTTSECCQNEACVSSDSGLVPRIGCRDNLQESPLFSCSHGKNHGFPWNFPSETLQQPFHQAEKFYFGGLVLIAPFLSLRDALGQQLDR
jgi:hypothetical protein